MVSIVLTVLRCPDSVHPDRRQMTPERWMLGRAPFFLKEWGIPAERQWSLPDVESVVSKNHCVIEFANGVWQLTDISANGTFLNDDEEAIGANARPVELHAGDRLTLGPYEIEVSFQEELRQSVKGWSAQPPAPAPPVGGGGGGGGAGAGWGFGAGSGGLIGSGPDGGSLGSPFGGSPGGSIDGPIGGLASFAGEEAPGAANIGVPPWKQAKPVDGAPPPWAPKGQRQAQPQGPWQGQPQAQPDFGAPVPAPKASGWPPKNVPKPFGGHPAPGGVSNRLEAPSPVVFPGSVPTPRPAPVAAPIAAPVGAPIAAPVGAPVGDPIAAAVPALDIQAGEALAHFLLGAKVSEGMVAGAGADPLKALSRAGSVLFAALAGMRKLLIARGQVKQEYRIEKTMIGAGLNNPLKFSASDEHAVAAMLDPRTQALMMIREVVSDLYAHQIATVEATQVAAKSLLEQLAPEKLEKDDQGGGVLPGAREKRLWEAYRRRHAQLSEQLDDDFDSAFGKAFARAYEQAAERGE